MSLGINRRAGNSDQSRMDIGFPCYSDFFGVASSRTGARIRNDEVVGSIPTSSTKSCNHLAGRILPAFHRRIVRLVYLGLAAGVEIPTTFSS